MSAAPLPLVFVTVGTDHHPFDRLIRWVDGWMEHGGAERARCFVQTGTSLAPRAAEFRPYLSYEEMARSIREAAVVVCHGGPGTIITCRHLGRKPLVVPRQSDLGEHVDDHQVAFTARLAAEGQIDLLRDEARFRQVLDHALETGTSVEDRTASDVAAAARRFEELVSGMMARSRRRRPAGAR
jgi:UDP-N-acetylglucosamine transferase subunit ALG13